MGCSGQLCFGSTYWSDHEVSGKSSSQLQTAIVKVKILVQFDLCMSANFVQSTYAHLMLLCRRAGIRWQSWEQKLSNWQPRRGNWQILNDWHREYSLDSLDKRNQDVTMQGRAPCSACSQTLSARLQSTGAGGIMKSTSIEKLNMNWLAPMLAGGCISCVLMYKQLQRE